MKKCRVCRLQVDRWPIQPRNRLAKVCSIECARVLARVEGEKQARRQLRERKEAIKTRAQWMKEAQQAVNEYVRLRDIAAGRGCISCGKKPEAKYGGAMDCGHYRAVGSAPHLRFYLKNMALQCVKCNRFLSSNSVEYRKNLIERIGIDEVRRIELNNEEKRFTIDYLKRLKTVFRKKSRLLKKRMQRGE